MIPLLTLLNLLKNVVLLTAYYELRDAPGNEGPHSVGVWTLKKKYHPYVSNIYIV